LDDDFLINLSAEIIDG